MLHKVRYALLQLTGGSPLEVPRLSGALKVTRKRGEGDAEEVIVDDGTGKVLTFVWRNLGRMSGRHNHGVGPVVTLNGKDTDAYFVKVDEGNALLSFQHYRPLACLGTRHFAKIHFCAPPFLFMDKVSMNATELVYGNKDHAEEVWNLVCGQLLYIYYMLWFNFSDNFIDSKADNVGVVVTSGSSGGVYYPLLDTTINNTTSSGTSVFVSLVDQYNTDRKQAKEPEFLEFYRFLHFLFYTDDYSKELTSHLPPEGSPFADHLKAVLETFDADLPFVIKYKIWGTTSTPPFPTNGFLYTDNVYVELLKAFQSAYKALEKTNNVTDPLFSRVLDTFELSESDRQRVTKLGSEGVPIGEIVMYYRIPQLDGLKVAQTYWSLSFKENLAWQTLQHLGELTQEVALVYLEDVEKAKSLVSQLRTGLSAWVKANPELSHHLQRVPADSEWDTTLREYESSMVVYLKEKEVLKRVDSVVIPNPELVVKKAWEMAGLVQKDQGVADGSGLYDCPLGPA